MPAQESSQKAQQQAPPEATGAKSLSQTPRIEPEKELFSWKAPSRIFKRKGREFWVRLFAIASVLGFILFIVEGTMPVILLIALLFLFYILSTVEPEEVECKITNRGIRVADRVNEWELMLRFWFTKRANTDLLVLETLALPGRLELVINDKEKEKLRELLARYVPEEESSPTRLDRASDWLSDKLMRT